MIYVDRPKLYPFGPARHRAHKWSHMWTDGDIKELHDMAFHIGLKGEWFQDHALIPHYDVLETKRLLAINRGARKRKSMKRLIVALQIEGKGGEKKAYFLK